MYIRSNPLRRKPLLPLQRENAPDRQAGCKKFYGFFWMDMAITGSARGILSAHGGLQAAMG